MHGISALFDNAGCALPQPNSPQNISTLHPEIAGLLAFGLHVWKHCGSKRGEMVCGGQATVLAVETPRQDLAQAQSGPRRHKIARSAAFPSSCSGTQYKAAALHQNPMFHPEIVYCPLDAKNLHLERLHRKLYDYIKIEAKFEAFSTNAT